jgi:hypothetical protein
MPRFERYIGVRYSGRKLPTDAIRWLRVFASRGDNEPYQEWNQRGAEGRWSRRDLAEWLLEELAGELPTVVGLSHAFSFPQSYMDRHDLKTWDDFLRDFEQHWPTQRLTVRELLPGNVRTGDPDERRLTGRWAGSPPGGVFRWEPQDGLAKATHAGVPWLDYLRRGAEGVHFWPFDGFKVPKGSSVVAEVRPTHLQQRYPREDSTREEHEAYAICAWLRDRDRQSLLDPYFTPPLSESEQARARLEGWILGVS